MSWNTSSGWETGDAWLDAISIVVAPILLAIKRSRWGLIVRSFLETRYHDGTCFQAGGPDRGLKHTGATGYWLTASTRATGSCTACKKSDRNPGGSPERDPV